MQMHKIHKTRCGQRRKWYPCSWLLHIFTFSVCDRVKKQSWWGDERHLKDVTETINTILHHQWTSLELPPSKSVTTVPGLYLSYDPQSSLKSEQEKKWLFLQTQYMTSWSSSFINTRKILEQLEILQKAAAFGCIGGAIRAQQWGPWGPAKNVENSFGKLCKNLFGKFWENLFEIVCGNLFGQFCGNPFEIFCRYSFEKIAEIRFEN